MKNKEEAAREYIENNVSFKTNWKTVDQIEKAFIAGAEWREEQAASVVSQDTSDGYHTFRELYEHRRILTVSLFNLDKSNCFKSWFHSDGTMFKDYFIVGVNTQLGSSTYHYHKDYWEYFKCKELSLAPEWDGHTAKDAIERISLHFSLLQITLDKENSSAKLLAEKDKEIERLKKESLPIQGISDSIDLKLEGYKEVIREMREALNQYGNEKFYDPEIFLCGSDLMREDLEETNYSRFTPGKTARACLTKNSEKIKSLLGGE